MSDYYQLEEQQPTPAWAKPNLKRSRWWIAAAIGALLCFSYLVFGDHSLAEKAASRTKQFFTGGSPSEKPQKTTVILIWQERGHSSPAYTPYFFQSVEANPDVDLLLINVDKEEKGCTNFSNATNVHEVCLSEAECAFPLHQCDMLLTRLQTTSCMLTSCASVGNVPKKIARTF